MAENLEPYLTNGKKSIRQTKSPTPAETIEMLQQAIIRCQQSGIDARYSTMFSYGQQCVVVVLANCSLINGNITLQS